jgi:hypothetical protein
MPKLAPCAPSRSGMTSALYVPASGPSLTENATMKASTDATVAAMLATEPALLNATPIAGNPRRAGEEERPPAEVVAEERGHQDEARLDDPDTDGGEERSLVRCHAGLPEHQCGL